MKSIEKLAIANRGEIAVRILRACQDMGIESVLLHSEADIQSMAYRMADHRVCIGPPLVADSYLNIENTLHGALCAQADAIHPGFGFLSENAHFAQACADKHLIFVGPRPQSIRLFGNKVSAKKLVQDLGIECLPGYLGQDQSLDTLVKEAEKIGYPLMVKAAGGGGGRGLKIIHKAHQAQEAIESAQREGSNLDSQQVFLEKYLEKAKHIEFQIFGGADGQIYHLMDRECSVQRRHQKLIEEAVSPSIDFNLRQQMANAAVRIAQKAQYQGAGTIEFLLQEDRFYFLEMNTRLQVEHPVTELVLGVDLVEAQILTAQGSSLTWNQEEFHPRGHAIECRIYTENPYQNARPCTGTLGGCYWPQGPGRRFELGFEPGDEITPFYDGMIAKVVVWAETRVRAIRRMRRTLGDTVIFGLQTNIPQLQEILSHPEFISGEMTTRFIDQHFPNGLQERHLSETEKKVARLAAKHLSSHKKPSTPWMIPEQP